ncbi:MAG: anthranilate synthase component I family protein [Nitrospirae bacterium]|nr:anthranilate synthase component I family protein [Nitrospirota bacterium]
MPLHLHPFAPLDLMLNVLPTKKIFIEEAQRGRVHPVYAELPFIPPQQVYESIRGPYSFLLESIKGPEKIARYSFAGAEPFMTYSVKNGSIAIQAKEKNIITSLSPLKKLKELIASYNIEPAKGLPPFLGGAVGLISYDFVHYLERLLRNAIDDLQIPDAHFLLVDNFAAFDHKDKKTFLVSCPADLYGGPYDLYYDAARQKIHDLHIKINSMGREQKGVSQKISRPVKIKHEMHKKDYMEMVRRTKEYIKAGDIFQANLSQRVSADIGEADRWKIYKILSAINPSPFAAYLYMGDYQVISSSPERLLRFSEGSVETRPIAGTRPRGADAEADSAMRKELLLNEKERAEHLMMIDLERNDLGKISDYGSVAVDEFMITEDYSHVIHIVSNIKGRIAGNKDCFDAIRAAFPGGTITGVPKVRCMEIIDELEPVARGPYTGSIGYIGFSGAMDLNIVIRSFVIKNDTAYVQAGAGIVADSDPEREYFETLRKAEALIKTVEML